MKLAAQKDILAAPADAFAILSDFEHIAALLRARKTSLRRTDRLVAPGAGLSWDAGFVFRGKPRSFVLDLTEYRAPERMTFRALSPALEVEFRLRLAPVEGEAGRTRMRAATQFTPRTLPARLMLRTAALTQGSLQRRYAAFFARVAQGVAEEAARRAAL